MPVECPVSLPRLTTAEFRDLDFKIMELAFETHRLIGRLADEAVYQQDLAARLESAGWPVLREVLLVVAFGTFRKTYRLDLVVDSKMLYELKTVASLTSAHEAQTMNYLLLLDASRGKLVNFRPTSVKSRFVNAPMTSDERRAFEVDDSGWHGDAAARDGVVALLRDLGTALDLSLYIEAISHLLSFNIEQPSLLPLSREGTALGNQRFHLIEPDAAIRVTAFPNGAPGYANDLRRLRRLSPLRAIHWINIGYHTVTFETIK